MTEDIKVRPARTAEIPTLARLVENQLPDMMAGRKRPENIEHHLSRLIPDQCLMLATRGNRLAGLIAVDLDQVRVLACYLDPDTASPDTPRRLFSEAEQLAASYGARKLSCKIKKQVSGFMASMGYEEPPEASESGGILVEKDLASRATPEFQEIMKVLDELGVPQTYGLRRRLRLVPEAKTLVSIGPDIFNRDQRLTPAAATALGRMRSAASNNGIDLQLISAYRGINYQVNLIRRKLNDGKSLDDILKASAAPGYSEHHGGRAVDLTTPGCKPLEESFAETRAYQWLKANAGIYGFRESYGMANRHGISWEPWHWCYHHRPGR